MASAIKLQIAAVLAAYTGRVIRTSKVQVAQDPVFSDVWAVRWTPRPDIEADFVVDLRGTLDEQVEAVEEVLFESFPPMAVHQN